MKKGIKILAVFSLILLGLPIIFLAYITWKHKKPFESVNLIIENSQEKRLSSYTQFKITTFNIGYAGLDAKQDFFMDGGTGSRSRSKEQTIHNLQHMSSFLKEDRADFILLQEVDIKALRSFGQNEYQLFQQELSSHASTFGYNYRNPWVPVPFLRPMGYVESGLATFSTYFIQQATRFQLPGREPWPKQLFDLDRAMVEHIIPVENGKNLRIVNIHASAYDAGGNIRKQQLQYVKQYMHTQYQKGDYVVVGGDWNQLLSDIQLQDPTFLASWPKWLVRLPQDFTEGGFQWAVDSSVYTVRDNRTAYIKGKSFVTIIDGFLVSPNVEILQVKGHDLQFTHSDHNPVSAVFQLQ
ncbi:endonuclease/exonuclease/phosphatase family protein [Bacillus thuringiensis]|uniref:endonuclease/exonuclease/phosphatase family protein n=1 Tax=Bacillus thuringiensis TaxID=1428 RepID=UPI0018CE7484|nr:endonuclease/exonuclease/phosphatase family protein [Bacillus thuringiensis]EKS8367443.1 endonuclease/exonuclease/phosphatase family protein [Bacillus cereus]EKS8373701.1 endonuclease/exonuclease/phosphatase family protein [Bacillus cereus]MBG9492067.1 endonuclease [Bacillus thuringiensis]MBG9516582.1 endonuclease [Bacillus thuringiensis]MED3392683.1 endonuclease/exonuclease/phosphatase family protein [Bacillus thuringiensis]